MNVEKNLVKTNGVCVDKVGNTFLLPGLGTCGYSLPDTGKTSSLQQSPLPKLGSSGNCTHHKAWKIEKDTSS